MSTAKLRLPTEAEHERLKKTGYTTAGGGSVTLATAPAKGKGTTTTTSMAAAPRRSVVVAPPARAPATTNEGEGERIVRQAFQKADQRMAEAARAVPGPAVGRASAGLLAWNVGVDEGDQQEIIRRCYAILQDKAARERLIDDVLVNQVLAHRVRAELYGEKEQQRRQAEQETKARGIEAARRSFSRARVGDLPTTLGFFVDTLPSGSACFAVTLNGGRDRVVFQHPRDAGKVMATASEVGGRIEVDLSASTYTAISVEPDAAEAYAKLARRFSLARTLSWRLPGGGEAHLFDAALEDRQGERISKALVPGLTITSAGTIPLPLTAGDWLTMPDSVVQPEHGAGLPSISADLRKLIKDTANADSGFVARAVAMMISEAAA